VVRRDGRPAAGAARAAPGLVGIDAGRADLVVAANLLHLHPRPVELVDLLVGLLGPGGRLICSWPRADAGPRMIARAERYAGVGRLTVAVRAAARCPAGVAGALTRRRVPAATLRASIICVAARYRLAATWIDLPEAAATLVVVAPRGVGAAG
jgi:SAM-dependent methyltransferase